MKTTTINPSALYWASFNAFELRIPGQCAMDCSTPGRDASDSVKHWLPKVRAQIEKDCFPNKPTPDKIRAELAEYGAWEDSELNDADTNMERLIWIAACNIRDDDERDFSEPVATVKSEGGVK